MEKESIRLQESFEQVMRLIADGVVLVGRQGEVLHLNRAAERLTGWSNPEARGLEVALVIRLVDHLSREPVPCPVARVLKSGLGVGETGGRDLLNRKGVSVALTFQVYPMHPGGGAVVILRDQAAQRQLESRHLQIQSLETVALLAGGIAHDFNNLLMGIQGSLALAQMEALSEEARSHLDLAERAVVRAGHLGRQLLSLSRGNAPVLESVPSRRIVEEICVFSLRGSGVGLQLESEDGLWPCLMDEASLSRIINNLLINARQAMEGKGQVQVRLHNRRVSGMDGLPLKSGAYLCIEVEDDGPGIPAEHLARVFDPFFTTKAEGTGLGLANCKAIVQANRGHIAIESEVGRGTLFTLYLPAEAKAAVEEDAMLREEAPLRGEGEILLMDDEELIRAIAGDLLTHLGYTVTAARDGEEALEFLKEANQAGRRFSAAILDLTVPGKMGGLETKKHLEEQAPELPVVVSSGYGNDPVVSRFEEYGFVAAIVKPYTLHDLGLAIRRACSLGEGKD